MSKTCTKKLKKSDNEIIEEIKNNINSSINMNHLIEKHSGLFYKICNRYLISQDKTTINDFYRDKNFYFYQYILDYNPSKNTKFSTYLGNRVKWSCLNLLKKTQKNKNYISDTTIEDCQNFIPSSKDESLDKLREISDVIKILKKDPDKRVFEIFKYRYLKGKNNGVMPWKEVSSQPSLLMSIQGCINIHNNFLKKIRKKQN